LSLEKTGRLSIHHSKAVPFEVTCYLKFLLTFSKKVRWKKGCALQKKQYRHDYVTTENFNPLPSFSNHGEEVSPIHFRSLRGVLQRLGIRSNIGAREHVHCSVGYGATRGLIDRSPTHHQHFS
jgi:hypothetical protein